MSGNQCQGLHQLLLGGRYLFNGEDVTVVAVWPDEVSLYVIVESEDQLIQCPAHRLKKRPEKEETDE